MATFEIEYQSAVLDMVRHVSVIYPDAAEVNSRRSYIKGYPCALSLTRNGWK